MRLNKQYKKLYRKQLLKQANKRRKTTLWLNRKSERHVQIMVAMFFVGFSLTLTYGYKTLITWSNISQIYFGLAVIFSFIPSKWLPFIYQIRKELKVLLGVCALAPLFTGLVLALNYHIPKDKVYYTINIVNYQKYYSDKTIIVTLNDENMNKYDEIRKFSIDKFNFEPDSACYLLYTGVFGIKTVHESWLIPK